MTDDEPLLEISAKLFAACSSGDAAGLRKLLADEPYAKAVLDLTRNPIGPAGKKISDKTIHAACSRGHLDVVRCLLQAGIDPNINGGGGTPIYAAAKGGYLDTVKLLVEMGADYKNIHGGFSPLFVSCTHGKLAVLKYLAELGANLNAFDNPPLVFTACISGHLDLVKYFIEERRVDINHTSSGKQADGKNTLLYVACQMKKESIVKYLIERGTGITRTILDQFPGVISKVIQEYFRATGHGTYHARLKEMGLDEVPWSFFASHSSTLTKVDLHGNRLTSLPVELLQLVSLEDLNVSHNQLPALFAENMPWECKKLSKLDASHNALQHIPSGVFRLPELTNLSLSYNQLQTLPGDPECAMTYEDPLADGKWSCQRIKTLILSHNHLKSLPDVFGDLRDLRVLYLVHNELVILPQSLCWGALNLVHLDASHNQLTDLPMGACNYWMHSLERLFLSNNKFTEISKNVTELSHLTTLDLSNNMIGTLPPTHFWTGQRINKVNLAGNRLFQLSHAPPEEEDRTRGAPKVRSRNSKITRLFNFKRKKVSKEKIQTTKRSVPADGSPRELPVGQWASCLHHLHLQYNSIEFLPDYLGLLTDLKVLDISGNTDIRSLPPSLGKLQELNELVMNGVSITNVPPHFLPGVSREGSTKHTLAYLRTQFRNCVPYNRMKLMVVGLQGRGKTTLLSVLRDPSAPLPENISTVGVSVADWVVRAPDALRKNKGGNVREAMDVVFSTWDMAGQEVYYSTHQCFLSRNTLYLVVWNVEEGERGIQHLKPWLLNIQSRAPSSPVIIVGTHMDRLPEDFASDLKAQYTLMIKAIYEKVGFPSLSNIQFVSCVSKEGIKELQDKIHAAAMAAKTLGTKELIIGKEAPASYVALQKVIADEVQKCNSEKRPPILNQEAFASLASSIPNSDIVDPEDLSIAVQFLHDNGILLHYNDHLKGLNNLYFIDPIWLANLLAEIITVPERQTFVQNGILKEYNVPFIFRNAERFPTSFYKQYLQLLERYEIALSLGDGQYLIPSMLPIERPILIGLNHFPVTTATEYEEQRWSKQVGVAAGVDGEDEGSYPMVTEPTDCIKRRYIMAYIPSGFWSRLISRLLINLERSCIAEGRRVQMAYWRRGLMVSYEVGGFLVESISPHSTEISGVAVTFDTTDNLGVDMTVWTSCGEFSAMGYIVDQLDSLIDEWFPGLNDFNDDGTAIVQREVVWLVPVVHNESAKVSLGSRKAIVFPVEVCCFLALTSDQISVRSCGLSVPLVHLVPDILLADLEPRWIINHDEFLFNPKDPATCLGLGGSGAVYQGKYKGQMVAIKEPIFRGKGQDGSIGEDDDEIFMKEALCIFREFRQEVTVLSQLEHPNIVALLGVSIRPLCMAIEYAPMGSLFDILEMEMEKLKQEQADVIQVSPVLRMPGGVLGHVMTTKVALQVAHALEYIHTIGIIYRDLKSDNVLVWSIDPNDKVNIKLADYGISRFANPGGVKGSEGTPGYQAPETIHHKGEEQAYNEKVDMFSFAMLLYELLTGQRPFESSTNTHKIDVAISRGERPSLSECNLEPAFPAMVELMEDCWRHAPSERPAAHEIVTRMDCPGFLCRKHTITTCMDQPLPKVDVVCVPPPASGPHSDDYTVLMWARMEPDKLLCAFDARRGTFRQGASPFPTGRACASVIINQGERKRLWVSALNNCVVQIYCLDPGTEPKHLWSFKMNDAVLSFQAEVKHNKVTRIFAGLVKGGLCIFTSKNTAGNPVQSDQLAPCQCEAFLYDDECRLELCDWVDPLFLQLNSPRNSVKCMTLAGSDRLWCGCGNGIVVVDTVNAGVLQQIPVFAKRSTLVNELAYDGSSVWGIGSLLSCVLQWDVETYSLVRVLDSSIVDPTGLVITTELEPAGGRILEDIFGRDPQKPSAAADEEGPISPLQSPISPLKKTRNDELSFSVSQTSPSVRSRSLTVMAYRKSQRIPTHKKNRHQSCTSTVQEGQPPAPAAEKTSTSAKSLLVVDDALWIGRGMGDVIVVDVSRGPGDGKVLARLATCDCKKYGNRSHNKLVAVGGRYVVSTLWLEPIDRNVDCSHQEINVWEAWTRKRIEEYSDVVSQCGTKDDVFE